MNVENTLRAVANANDPQTVRQLLGGRPNEDLSKIFSAYVSAHPIGESDRPLLFLASIKIEELGEASKAVSEIGKFLALTPEQIALESFPHESRKEMVLEFVQQLPEDRVAVIDRLRGISDLSEIDKVVTEASSVPLPLRAAFVLKWVDQLPKRSWFSFSQFPDTKAVLDTVKREEVLKRLPKEIILSEVEEPTATSGEFTETKLAVSSADLVDRVLTTIEKDPNHLFQVSDFGIPLKLQSGFNLDGVSNIFATLFDLEIIQSYDVDIKDKTILLSPLPSSAKSSAEMSRTSSVEEVSSSDTLEADVILAERLGLERGIANEIALIDDRKERQSILNRVAIVVKEVRAGVLTYLVNSYAKGEQEVAEKRVNALFGTESPYSKEMQIALAPHLSNPHLEEYLPLILEGTSHVKPEAYEGLVAALLQAPSYEVADEMVGQLKGDPFWSSFKIDSVTLRYGEWISPEELVKMTGIRGAQDIPTLIALLQESGKIRFVDGDPLSGYFFRP